MTLPAPMTPPESDLRGIEPPWEAFIELAIAQFGITRAEAERLVAQARVEAGKVQ